MCFLTILFIKQLTTRMGNHIAAIDEQQLDEWISKVAMRAGAACDSRLSTMASSLIKLLEDLQADKDLLTKVAAQQGELLKNRHLDMTPLVQKLEFPRQTEDITAASNTLNIMWVLLILLAVILLILIVFCIIVIKRPKPNSAPVRPILKRSNSESNLNMVRFNLDKPKSSSLRSILPV